MGTGEVESF